MGFERVDSIPFTSELGAETSSTILGGGIQEVKHVLPAMGTRVEVVALDESRDRLEEATGRAFLEMDRLISLLSRFDESSAVTCLNDQGSLTDVPPELSKLIDRSLRFFQLSGGLFDISVEPVVDLFRERLCCNRPVEPTRQEIADALDLVGSDHIALYDGRVRLGRSGMKISLNGIAKGFIVDAVARVLLSQGIEDFLINAGGDIRTSGAKEDRRPWTVAIQDPFKEDRFPDTIHLTDGAVATAGCYERAFDNERRYHHLVNTETGLSPHVNLSVSVVAPSAMAADALATSIFAMEPFLAMRFTESLRGCECLVVDRSGIVHTSPGWISAAPDNKQKAEL